MMDELIWPIFSSRARAFYARALMLRCLLLAYEGRRRGLLSNDLSERSRGGGGIIFCMAGVTSKQASVELL